jgi:hypothetical protein
MYSVIRQGIYGITIGVLVGAWPFWVLALVRNGERWPARLALAVSLILSGTAFRVPAAWALGVAVGATSSWAALAILVGTEWRLLPYVLLLFPENYIGGAVVIVTAHVLGHGARHRSSA